jgi:hypothetical protein
MRLKKIHKFFILYEIRTAFIAGFENLLDIKVTVKFCIVIMQFHKSFILCNLQRQFDKLTTEYTITGKFQIISIYFLSVR